MFADYDKIYQNVFPGAVNEAGTEVSISAYNNRNRASEPAQPDRDDATALVTGAIEQTLLGGVAVGRQITDNFRKTGLLQRHARPRLRLPYRAPDDLACRSRSARARPTRTTTLRTTTRVVLRAESDRLLAATGRRLSGLRYERFDVDFYNKRTGEALEPKDDLVSPRAGLLFKPTEPVTLYTSYSVSALAQLRRSVLLAERRPPRRSSPKSSRTTRSAPNGTSSADLSVTARGLPPRSHQHDGARPERSGEAPCRPAASAPRAFEFGVTGAITPEWQIIGGYANQDADDHQPDRGGAAPGAKVAAGAPEHGLAVEPLPARRRAGARAWE